MLSLHVRAAKGPTCVGQSPIILQFGSSVDKSKFQRVRVEFENIYPKKK